MLVSVEKRIKTSSFSKHPSKIISFMSESCNNINITITSDEAIIRDRLEFVISEIFQFQVPSIQGPSLLWRTEQGLHITVLTKKNTLGRDPNCNIQIDDNYASRIHSSIRQQEMDWILVDENSRNGTWYNQKKTDIATLNSGDVIRIGSTYFVFMDVRNS